MGDGRTDHGLDDRAARWMIDGGDAVRGPAGAQIDPRTFKTLCLLTQGWMIRTRHVSEDRTAVLATYLPGDIVMLDVWSGSPAGDQLHSLTPTEMICRSINEFEAALDTDPAVSRAVIRRLGQEAGLLRVGLTALGRLDAQDRMLVFLHQLHERLVAGGSLRPEARRFPCPMTQAQLANAIGITSVHANRVLSALRQAKVLTVASGHVEIHDWTAFQALTRALPKAA